MNEVDQNTLAFNQVAVTLDELIGHLIRTGTTTPRQVLHAAQQLGVEAELTELFDLLVTERHAFVLEGPADEWRVLHPPMCETIKSLCPYESAERVRADRAVTGSGTYEVRLEPGDIYGLRENAVLVIGDKVA
jgi:hypothetical protein